MNRLLPLGCVAAIRYWRLRFAGISLAVSLILVPSVWAQAPAAPLARANYKVSGTVVNAVTGEPITNARIYLRLASNPSQFVTVLSSQAGRFEFDDVPAGKFRLVGDVRGFIAAAYNQHEQFSTAIVTGAGISTDNLVLRLMPLASITGTVSDEHGDPVRNANVSLFVESHRGGMIRTIRVSIASTDDLGSFEFPFVGPGTFFLCVSARPWYAVYPATSPEASGVSSQRVDSSLDVVYPTTFYGGATDSASATPLVVRGGDHAQADIHLNPVPGLHLFFRAPAQEEAGRGFVPPLIQKRLFDAEEHVLTETPATVSPGTVELAGIPPGNYSVRFQEARPAGGPVDQSEPVQMTLTENGQELDSSHAEPAASVKITAKLPRDENPPRQVYFALRNSRRQVVSSARLEDVGTAFFASVPPGKYSIAVNTSGTPYAIARLLSGETEIPGGEMELAPRSSLDLTAVLVAGFVSVEGIVHKAGKPAAGVMIALVPKDPQTHLEYFRRDQSDLDGTFVVRGVIPGQYTVIAVEDAWGTEWLKAGVLSRYLQRGQTLNIGELMHRTVYLPEPLEAQPR